MFVNEMLTGIGRRLFQRLVMMVVIVVVLRSIGFFMGQSEDGTFRSTSSDIRAGSAPSAPDEDDHWGTDSTKTKPDQSTRDQDSSEIPVYDPGKDGGWGSN